jgi:hypothetical protein
MKFSTMQRLFSSIQLSWSRARGILIFLLLFLLAVSSLAWRQPPETRSFLQIAPTPTRGSTQTIALTPTGNAQNAQTAPSARPTLTPLPPEYVTNSQQTTGIIFVASIMVLIVVFGVLHTLVTEKRPSR